MMDRETLFQLYILEQKTTKEIAAIAKVQSSQTISNWLQKCNIPIRDNRAAQRPKIPTVDELNQLYIDQKLSIDKIWRIFGTSESTISRLLDEYGIQKRSNTDNFGGWNRGKQLSASHKERLRELAKQRTGAKSPRFGASLSAESRAKIANSLKGRFRGVENPNWKGGTKHERTQWSSRYEYKEWRSAVFERDQYTCQMCSAPSTGSIQAHHVRPWRTHIENRFDISNGITLCITCHRSIKGREMEHAEKFDSIIRQPTP